MLKTIPSQFRKLSDSQIAEHSQKFFKTGPGEYGYGDVFLGIRMPVIRKFAKDHGQDLSRPQIQVLIQSKYHEERMLGLIILVNQYKKVQTDKEKNSAYNFYIKNFKFINNWDLVDVTCPHIIGPHLIDKDRDVLYKWARSKDLWVKRISIVTNWWFIRKNDLKDVFKISQILLQDDHDLIHKAVGWMLREAGKKDLKKLETFLQKNHQKMPRTMLRYAIERFPESKRQRYLKGTIKIK